MIAVARAGGEKNRYCCGRDSKWSIGSCQRAVVWIGLQDLVPGWKVEVRSSRRHFNKAVRAWPIKFKRIQSITCT